MKKGIHRSRCILSLPSCRDSLRARSILSKVIQEVDVFTGYHRMHYCVNFLTYKLCIMKRKQIHSCVCWTPSAQTQMMSWCLFTSKTLPFDKNIKGSWSRTSFCNFIYFVLKGSAYNNSHRGYVDSVVCSSSNWPPKSLQKLHSCINTDNENTLIICVLSISINSLKIQNGLWVLFTSYAGQKLKGRFKGSRITRLDWNLQA